MMKIAKNAILYCVVLWIHENLFRWQNQGKTFIKRFIKE